MWSKPVITVTQESLELRSEAGNMELEISQADFGVRLDFNRPNELRRLSWERYQGQEGQCAICLDSMRIGADVYQVEGCKHVFHRRCLGRWLEEAATCPLCRRRLS